VTIARSLSNTFAGIAPSGVMAFIVAQLIGAGTAVLLSGWLWRTSAESKKLIQRPISGEQINQVYQEQS
jgi:glycerol uptake facilitator-like aquaporin